MNPILWGIYSPEFWVIIGVMVVPALIYFDKPEPVCFFKPFLPIAGVFINNPSILIGNLKIHRSSLALRSSLYLRSVVDSVGGPIVLS